MYVPAASGLSLLRTPRMHVEDFNVLLIGGPNMLAILFLRDIDLRVPSVCAD